MATQATPPPVADRALREILAAARSAGFLGPAPLDDHLQNGRDFADVARIALERQSAPHAAGATVVDLGSGAGVPGLIVASSLDGAEVHLVDRGERRCTFLEEAVDALGFSGRVHVSLGDAEDLARTDRFAGVAHVVTARSFGPPAVTAEAACRILRPNGYLVVSEPPASDGARWPEAGLRELGFAPVELHRATSTTLALIERTDELDSRFPRRAAANRKRPLF